MKFTSKIASFTNASLMVAIAHTPGDSTFNAFTPRGMDPGSPAGSHPLSSLDNINLDNGSENYVHPAASSGRTWGSRKHANVAKPPRTNEGEVLV